MEQTVSEQGFFAEKEIHHQQWLRGEVLKSQLAYWKQQIDDGNPGVVLPTDRPRLADQTFRGRTRMVTLPLSLTESLKALSRDEDVTLFMTLLAAFQLLLQRYTGQDDITIGNLTRINGGSVNPLVLRTDLSGNPSFRELLDRVREVVVGAYAHQDLPFEQLMEELKGREASRYKPPFQVMFVVLDSQVTNSELDRYTSPPVNGKQKEMELVLAIKETTQGLKASFEYNSELFEDTTMARMLGHFQTLLFGIVANPDWTLSKLPLLTEAERHQLLVEWNDTRTDYPKDRCVHQLFEAQVKERPNATALVFKEEQVTYANLNKRANQLAHYLRSLGVGPEVRVGICLERSVEMVVGILGILKAGGGYLPLDATYPKERLAFMLEDARASVLLTQQRLVGRLPDHRAKVVCLDTDWEAIAHETEENLVSGATAENLVYVIYTSGSTGTPKGVVLNHRGRVNNFFDFNQRFAVGPGDRLIALSSLSFDMCAYDVLGTLAAGGTIVMAEVSEARDPARWAELMVQHQVTVWHSVPAILEMLVEYVSNRPELHPRFLRLALLGGDWIPVSLPDRLKALAEGVQVISLGGATEASMDSTIYPIETSDPTWKSIPYGRPMANQLAYVLDGHLQLLPIGVPGELHLGGVGLAQGYFNRPELTAEKFVPNPFSQEPGDRLYKTGDLARYMPDGNLELLGRMDHQVKIHGHRIELGEIVAALKQHPAILQAVVLAREDEPGNKRLVAYVVPDAASKVTQSEFRNLLKKSLPEYMMPSALVFLDALPLSPNGKVDRRALPSPDSARPELGQAFVPPRVPLEHLLCEMWRKILGLERVGVQDDFFELGGSSIQGAVFINKLQEKLGELIHFVAIFDARTVADFAGYLNEHYPDAVSRICGTKSLHSIEPREDIAASSQPKKIDSSKADQMRQLLWRR